MSNNPTSGKDFNFLLNQLKQRPDTDVLWNTLDAISKITITDAQSFELTATLLDSSLINAFEILDTGLQKLICSLLFNRVGLSQLAIKVKNSTGNNKQSYSTVLIHTINQKDNLQLYDFINATNFREIKSLLVYKIPECLNEAYLEIKSTELDEITKQYNRIILNQIKAQAFKESTEANEKMKLYLFQLTSQIFSVSLESIGILLCDAPFFSWFANEFGKHQDKVFLKCLLQFLVGKVNDMNLNAYLAIVRLLNIKETGYLLSLCFDISNPSCMKLFIKLSSFSSPSQEIYQQLKFNLKKFGLKSYCSQISISVQENQAKFIVLLIQFLNNDQLESLSREKLFLDSITNRLGTTMPTARFLGMLIGDCVYEKLNNGKPMFNIDDHIKRAQTFKESLLDLSDNTPELSLEAAIDLINELKQNEGSASESMQIEIVEMNNEEERLSEITEIDSDEDDSDDDDPTVGRKKSVAKPAYLKELLSYLKSDSKSDNLAFEKRQLAFSIASQLIRIKKESQELYFYGDALLDTIINLSDEFKFDDFEAWKLSAIVSVTVGNFTNSVKFLIKNFVSGDLSMSLRVMILSCLSLSCRELSGCEDSFVLGKNKISNLGPQLLPEHIHKQFLEYEDPSTSKLFLSDTGDERPKIESINDDFSSLSLQGGTVTRMSSRLKKLGNNPKVTKTRDMTFINKKLSATFFTLISVWFTVNERTGKGFNIGSFSSILNSHFIKNLGIILDCSIPSCIELVQMDHEMLLLITDVLRTQEIEFQQDVFDSVLFCLKTVLRTETTVLRSRFSQELINISDVLTMIFKLEVILDQNSLQNCYFSVKRIEEILYQS